MKSSSPSSSSSSSVTAAPESQPSSSSPPHLPRLSLRSPELQAEFLQECENRFLSHGDVNESSVASPSPSSPLPSPFSPSPSGPSASASSRCYDSRQARLSLSSHELLSELKESRSRSLRRVPAHNGLTTVFCGRGRGGQASGPAPSSPSSNQKTSR